MIEMSLEELRFLQEDVRVVAHDQGFMIQKLTDGELLRFRNALRRIARSYWIVPTTIPKKLPRLAQNFPVDKKLIPINAQLFALDHKIDVLYKKIQDVWKESLGRGYRTIASIYESNMPEYLLGAMVAKEKFDLGFYGIKHEPRHFSMRPLKEEAWQEEDVVCISAFASPSHKQNIIRYEVEQRHHQNELTWIRDGDLYVSVLPATIIIKRKELADIPNIGKPIGIRYTKEWDIP